MYVSRSDNRNQIIDLIDNAFERATSELSKIDETICAKYHDIVDRCSYYDLLFGVEKLHAIFAKKDALIGGENEQELTENSREIKDFKLLCQKHVKQNEATALDFLPPTAKFSSQLYWNIAKLVWPGASFVFLIQIFMPALKQQLIPCVHISHETTSFRTNKFLDFEWKDLSEVFDTNFSTNLLLDREDNNDLSHLVISNSCLIDLKQISEFSFVEHQALYYYLQRTGYSDLLEQLQNHNEELLKLYGDIRLLNENGITPKGYIETIIPRLERGGVTYTTRPGSPDHFADAGVSALFAATQLHRWYEQLPADSKADLAVCHIGGAICYGGNTLAEVMSHIKNGECVELITGSLKAILKNPANNSILRKPQSLSLEEIKKIKSSYEGRRSSLERGRVETKVPLLFLEVVFKKLYFSSLDGLINCLNHLPTESYYDFFKYVNLSSPLQVELKQSLAYLFTFFSAEKRNMLAQLSLIFPSLFGELPNILAILINLKELAVIKFFLETWYTSEQRLNVLKSEIVFEYFTVPLLHWLAFRKEIEAIQMFLPLLSESDYVRAVGDMLLYVSVVICPEKSMIEMIMRYFKNSDQLCHFLENISVKQCQEVLKEPLVVEVIKDIFFSQEGPDSLIWLRLYQLSCHVEDRCNSSIGPIVKNFWTVNSKPLHDYLNRGTRGNHNIEHQELMFNIRSVLATRNRRIIDEFLAKESCVVQRINKGGLIGDVNESITIMNAVILNSLHMKPHSIKTFLSEVTEKEVLKTVYARLSTKKYTFGYEKTFMLYLKAYIVESVPSLPSQITSSTRGTFTLFSHFSGNTEDRLRRHEQEEEEGAIPSKRMRK